MLGLIAPQPARQLTPPRGRAGEGSQSAIEPEHQVCAGARGQRRRTILDRERDDTRGAVRLRLQLIRDRGGAQAARAHAHADLAPQHAMSWVRDDGLGARQALVPVGVVVDTAAARGGARVDRGVARRGERGGVRIHAALQKNAMFDGAADSARGIEKRQVTEQRVAAELIVNQRDDQARRLWTGRRGWSSAHGAREQQSGAQGFACNDPPPNAMTLHRRHSSSRNPKSAPGFYPCRGSTEHMRGPLPGFPRALNPAQRGRGKPGTDFGCEVWVRAAPRDQGRCTVLTRTHTRQATGALTWCNAAGWV